MLDSQTDVIEKVPKILKQKKMSRTRQDVDPNIPIYANCFYSERPRGAGFRSVNPALEVLRESPSG